MQLALSVTVTEEVPALKLDLICPKPVPPALQLYAYAGSPPVTVKLTEPLLNPQDALNTVAAIVIGALAPGTVAVSVVTHPFPSVIESV